LPKCANCGLVGDYPEITLTKTYIGGIGDRLIWYCTDIYACTRRADKMAEQLLGFETSKSEKEVTP